MEYLMKRMKIQGRFAIGIHDEVRFLVKEEDAHKCAWALQLSHLWTRSMFCSKLGFNDVPLNIAFFSSIDFDHCLRKEVYLTCVTPSNPLPEPPGESLDIYQLLEKCPVDDSFWGQDLTTIPPVKASPNHVKPKNLMLLKSQTLSNQTEIENLYKSIQKSTSSKDSFQCRELC